MLQKTIRSFVSYGPSPEDEAGALLVGGPRGSDRALRRERRSRGPPARHPPEGWKRTGGTPSVPTTVFVLAQQKSMHDMLHAFRIEDSPIPRPTGRKGLEPVPVEKGIPGSLGRMRNGEVDVLG